MPADLSKLSLKHGPAYADPTGNGENSIALVYTDDTGEFLLGFNVNLHGGRMTAIHGNPSPSDRRDELIVTDASGRLDIAG